MAFVDKFLSHYASHNDFSKASRFEVIIYPNFFLSEFFGNVVDLRLQCETAELPGYNFDTVDGRVYGVTYSVAARPAFSDLRLTFICAGDLWEKQLFDSWQEYIMPKTDYLPRYREEYVTDIEVRHYYEVTTSNITGQATVGRPLVGDAKPGISYRAKFIEAFPYTVDPITLSWADDGINRLNVGFKYKNWVSL